MAQYTVTRDGDLKPHTRIDTSALSQIPDATFAVAQYRGAGTYVVRELSGEPVYCLRHGWCETEADVEEFSS